MHTRVSSPGFGRNGTRCLASVAAAFLLPLTLSGCLQTVRLAELSSAEFQIGLQNQNGRICPREPVQIRLVAHGTLGGRPVILESWQGREPDSAITKGRLDFRDFTFSGNDGIVDAYGWFLPMPDVLATARSGFTIQAAHARTMQPLASLHALPDYACIAHAGESGADGQQVGMTGGDGLPGPRLRAMVTFVRTPFYDKLLAVRIEGDLQDFVLSPAERTLTIIARGGKGADGVDGQDGRDGADGHDAVCESSEQTSTDEKGNTHTKTREVCHAASAGEDGEDGRNGGDAGDGGPGGSIEVVLDRRFPELRALMETDVSGGAAGRGGRGGTGGDGGDGGYDGRRLPDGRYGTDGHDGRDGDDGSNGSANVRFGDVSGYFTDLPGVWIK